MLRDMEDLVKSARPNAAHIGISELERMGFLHQVITQPRSSANALNPAATSTKRLPIKNQKKPLSKNMVISP